MSERSSCGAMPEPVRIATVLVFIEGSLALSMDPLGAVPGTATHALDHATLPFVLVLALALADKAMAACLRRRPASASGVDENDRLPEASTRCVIE